MRAISRLRQGDYDAGVPCCKHQRGLVADTAVAAGNYNRPARKIGHVVGAPRFASDMAEHSRGFGVGGFLQCDEKSITAFSATN